MFNLGFGDTCYNIEVKIKKIELKKFKRFDDLTIELGNTPKKIIALVGPNGSGKSSVFDGFLFLQNHHESIGQFGARGALFYSKEQLPNYNDNFPQKVIIETDSGDFATVINTKRQTGDQKTIFSFRSSHRYSQNLNITTLSSLPSIKENNIGASQSVDLDEKIAQNYQRLYVYLNAYRKTNKLTDEQAIEQVLGQLNNILKECLEIEIIDLGDIMDSRGKLYFKKPDQSAAFDYNLLSSGEKEVVDILLDTFLKENTYVDSIYCIDEPELHLNTSIQRKLLIEIEKLIPDNCQLWVATHSIGFLRALQEELKEKSQILDFSEKNYFTGIQTMHPIKATRKNWQRIFQTALEDLTGLLAPRKIFYCEGKTEPSTTGTELGLDALVYNQIFEEEFTDILFVSSGGNSEPEINSSVAMKVLSKAFTDVSLFLLKDRDEKTDTERTEFLGQSSGNRMLKRREIENYIFDMEILKKCAADNGKVFDETKYNALVTNIATQDLKPHQQTLQQMCGETDTIKDFKIKLSNYFSGTETYRELKTCII